MTIKIARTNEKQLRTAEFRNASAEKQDEEMILQGYAATFEAPTVLFNIGGNDYSEVIARGAFDGANFKDCALKYNHGDVCMVMARTRGGTLETSTDDFGLKFNAKLFDISVARDAYTLVKMGGIDKCSFAFTIKEESYNAETRTWTVLKIDQVFDISIVDLPAYDNTSVEARSSAGLDRRKEQVLERANLVKRLTVRSLL